MIKLKTLDRKGFFHWHTVIIAVVVIVVIGAIGSYVVFRSHAVDDTTDIIMTGVDDSTGDIKEPYDPYFDNSTVSYGSPKDTDTPAAKGKIELLSRTTNSKKLPAVWNELPKGQPTSCSLNGNFKAQTKEGPEPLEVTFSSVGNERVNKYQIIYRYQIANQQGDMRTINQVTRNYTSKTKKQTAFDLVGKKSKGPFLAYDAKDYSDNIGYTQYTAKLIGWYRYTEILPAPHDQKFYLVKQMNCGSALAKNIKAKSAKNKKVAFVAKKEVGVREGSGRQAQYTAPSSASIPWCAAFARWSYQQVMKDGHFGNSNLTSDHYNRGVQAYNRDRSWVARPYQQGALAPGDFVYRINMSGYGDHTGIVESYNPANNILTTVEGNSSNQVSRNTCKIGSCAWSHFSRRMK